MADRENAAVSLYRYVTWRYFFKKKNITDQQKGTIIDAMIQALQQEPNVGKRKTEPTEDNFSYCLKHNANVQQMVRNIYNVDGMFMLSI